MVVTGCAEAVLVSRLLPALERLNPEASPEAIDLAVKELTSDRSAQSLPQATREIYHLLKDGVKVALQSEDGWEGGLGKKPEPPKSPALFSRKFIPIIIYNLLPPVPPG